MSKTSSKITVGSAKISSDKCEICGKPLIGKNEGIGRTCKNHLGLVGKFYVPVEKDVLDNPKFIPLTKLCDHAQKLGKSRYFAVKLTGKDAGTLPPFSPEFQVFTFSGRKFVPAESLKALEKIVKPEK